MITSNQHTGVCYVCYGEIIVVKTREKVNIIKNGVIILRKQNMYLFSFYFVNDIVNFKHIFKDKITRRIKYSI